MGRLGLGLATERQRVCAEVKERLRSIYVTESYWMFSFHSDLCNTIFTGLNREIPFCFVFSWFCILSHYFAPTNS